MDMKEPARAGLLVVVIRNTLANEGSRLYSCSGRRVVFSGDPEVVRSTERTDCRGQGHETGSRGKGCVPWRDLDPPPTALSPVHSRI